MHFLKKTALGILIMGASIVPALFLWQGYLQITGNFHEVVAGEYYRSAQPKPGLITKVVAEHHIRSILNLRGDHPGAPWYEQEQQEALAAGVKLINFRMSSGDHMTTDEGLRLIEVMRHAPKPMMVHCMAGADRTGLATALYLAAIKKDTEWNSEMQLSAIYGHVPLFFTKSFAMNETFEDMEPLLGYFDS